ncbi:chemotaxis protein methyltransferase [Pandoraea horticolens]|uniref:Chemotaxis protein methyltransferase n=1 Tax=Pandoraea horticolens TaxID=2508298 RepID=A0A5E4W1F2_9BURK|nr:CheR family methyltransferase [Pandoraea horticolens]VVE17110.1 chemotaxis protein methyltransferase [Pandoraea horticolens]
MEIATPEFQREPQEPHAKGVTFATDIMQQVALLLDTVNHAAAGDLRDLVMLRNMLIYFETADQERVFENVRRTLAPEGVLIAGESESLARLSTGYRFEQPLIYRNQGASNGAIA